MYGPLASDEQFTIEDFALLEKITLAKHGTKISHHIQEFGISGTQQVALYTLCDAIAFIRIFFIHMFDFHYFDAFY